MSSPSRRTFLATSSLAIAGISLGFRRAAIALPVRSSQPVELLCAEMVDAATLRMLAQRGVDAAKQAGAAYADIRISDRRVLDMIHAGLPLPFSWINFECAYGVRVCVDGVWGFAYGSSPAVDDIARAARSAVATAKGVAKVGASRSAMISAPVVTGEWATPVEIDPFAVSPDALFEVLGAYRDAATRIPDTRVSTRFVWTAETRIFASTEGSLITQRLMSAHPRVEVSVTRPRKARAVVQIPRCMPCSAGLEIAVGPDMQEHIKATTDELASLASYPEGRADVGRYEAIIDGAALGSIVGATLAQGLEMSRVLGYDADGAGTSCLAPERDILGVPLFAPALTVRADRSMPHYGAAKWDDEGVATEPFLLIERGRVVDYFTTRATASRLADWCATRGIQPTSHGAAVSWGPTTSPIGSASHITVDSGTSGTTLAALIQSIANGILVRGAQWVDTDHQLSGGVLWPHMVYEIRRGKITRRLIDGAIQFGTKNLCKAIAIMGDTSTRSYAVHHSRRGETWTDSWLPVAAPAAHLRQLDVTQYGRM